MNENNQTPKIGLDVDEVLAAWIDAWVKRYNFKETPKAWHFDPLILGRFEEMRKSGELDDFYLSIEPLIGPEDIPFEPHCYITSRPVDTEVTEKWLEMHKFPSRPVYTVPVRTSKAEAAKNADVDIFVDDSYTNFLDLNENGVTTYLYTTPQNKQFDVGDMRLNSLKDILLQV